MRKRIIIAGVIIAFLAVFLWWGTGFVYDITWARSAEERDALTTQIEKTQKEIENHPEMDPTLQYS
jgi:hypothetical protein